jgi:hypothetical protein
LSCEGSSNVFSLLMSSLKNLCLFLLNFYKKLIYVFFHLSNKVVNSFQFSFFFFYVNGHFLFEVACVFLVQNMSIGAKRGFGSL